LWNEKRAPRLTEPAREAADRIREDVAAEDLARRLTAKIASTPA
jgi:hypothetical protein